MTEHLYKNWMVYVLLGGFIYFVITVYIRAWRDEKKKQEQNNPQENSKKNKEV